MLQRAVREAMSHRPNELVSVAEVNRQYCNLLDSHQVGHLRKRMPKCSKAQHSLTEEIAAEAHERASSTSDVMPLKVLKNKQRFSRASQTEQPRTQQTRNIVPIKELRRAALFTDAKTG